MILNGTAYKKLTEPNAYNGLKGKERKATIINAFSCLLYQHEQDAG